MIQARFYVRELTSFAYNPEALTVRLAPVTGSYGKDGINGQWNTATPAGDISLTINNPDAAAWFRERLGKDLAITFDDRPESETTT